MSITSIFLKLLNMSFTGACAAILILLVRFLFKKFPKKYICILWAVVLIRLLCPFTIPTLVPDQPDIREPIPSNILEVEYPSIYSEIEIVDNAVNHVLKQNFVSDTQMQFKNSMSPLETVTLVGAIIWCIGIAAMFFYTIKNVLKFQKWIKESVPDRTLGDRIYRCAVSTPVVTGFVKPKIYLPFDLKEPQLEHVLMHEKMHIRRKDHWLKMLFYIAVIIHWFNPVVWLAYRLLERDMEMACDEAVLEELGVEEKTSYCESLLNLASSKNHLAGNPVAFGESDVKVRIKNLLNYKKPYLWISIAAIIVIVMVAITCLSSPKSNKIWETSVTAAAEVKYPLTKEDVEEALSQVDLPCVVSEEEYNSEIRTSLDLRDEEGRLIAGIASNGDGEARFLGITLIGYLQQGEASIYLPEEKWEDLIGFASVLYGFEDQNVVYGDFIKNFEEESIIMELRYTSEPYAGYVREYEWLKSYGDVSCKIEVRETQDGIREIESISFYNIPAYSMVNSEMACRNFFYYVFTSIPGRYAAYEEAIGGKYDPINRDERFLESDYSAAYLAQYRDRATENCLQTMEDFGYFTFVDYLAAKADARVKVFDAAFTEADETKEEKSHKLYNYTVTLNCEKDGQTEQFEVKGQIGVQLQVNGWKVYDFLISDTETLSIYVTGDSVYRQGNELPTDHEPQQLTMEMLLKAVETNSMEAVQWHNFADEVNTFADGTTSSYYIPCNLEHNGKELVLYCSFEKADESLRWAILTIKEDESSIRIYDGEEGGLRLSKEEIVEFVETDHDILNEIAFDLPEGLTLGAYNANIELEGGRLLLPMAYEGDEESTPDSWISSGVVSRFTQEYYLHWNGEKIERLSYYDNHTLTEVVEQVDGLCAPALLMSVEHDLYTAAQQAELIENGIDIHSVETQSKYWYLVIAEPGEEYGYVIALNQKNFTKEDILSLGKTIQLM